MNVRILICLLALGAAGVAQEATKRPVELGGIAWLRDIQEARGSEKPLLLLFQEVPG